ncbi:response regulator [Paenibacillus sp. P36]|uniref:response regulator transcription factor n=1 Tax=Paenibacillus sp. P36 TaxID=3342538 RepID=UPI0038B2F21A
MYKVFIVDDEELVVKSLKASVNWAACGFEVAGYALSGEEALAVIPQVRPHVVFSDIRMPGMSGLELIKHLSDTGISAKFMIVSGLAEFALAQKAMKQGVFGYCLKPFDEEEISAYLNKIKQELNRHEQLSEGDILDLIESGTAEAHHSLKEELLKAGIPHGSTLKLMLTVRKERIQLKAPCLSLKIGYRKFIYVLPETEANALASTMEPQLSRGIGFSSSFTDVSALSHAIQQAEVYAYHYFTLSSRLMGKGDTITSAVLEGNAKVIPAEEGNVALTRLDAMLPLFLSGQRDIRHALLLFNDSVSQFSRTGKEASDLFLYSYEQLVERFDDVHEMIVDLKRLYKEEKCDQAYSIHAGRNPTFKALLNYMNEHYCQNISIQSMSTMFNVNANYISQMFRKELDKTFTEYLTGLRIERAAALLRATMVPINEVADQVGYPDYFYFSKLFKKTTGVSPTSYRNVHTQPPRLAGP